MRNFWRIRSPYHGLLQAPGDVVVAMASDLGGPPERFPQLLEEWQKRFSVVAAAGRSTNEGGIYPFLRRACYLVIQKLSEVGGIEKYSVFGFVLSVLSWTSLGFYMVSKLLFWETIQMGIVRALVGVSFIMSASLAVLGLVGEYVALILIHPLNRPEVVEKERLHSSGNWGAGL